MITPILLITGAAFLLGMLGLVFHRQNLLSALLCLETLLLTLFFALSMLSHSIKLPTTAPQTFILLSLAACGACAGLSLLVATTRTHAIDLLKTLSLLKC
uniref:NADH-ubiquinone oxidoreductase chain 4L n=1 Tax=Pristurus rupestris rupestris TaxID=1530261 RepID=A0A343SA24_9SAUR|nr:NADH dehydrogenase subunit 4L [Pristurus rupestris rupestris]